MAKDRYLITSALPYANGPIHIGQLAGAYLPADIYARYCRLQGRDTLYICGSDEHGVPITIKAEKEGITPQDVVDTYHSRNKQAFEAFGMSFDNYSRTSLPVHHQTAQDFFTKLHEKGIFKKKTEEQLYDEEKQMFLPDRYVVGECPKCGHDEAYGDQCEKCGSSLSPTELINPRSALTDSEPEVRKTTHWYLPLGDLQDQLEEWILPKEGEWKSNVFSQVKGWLDQQLSDRAVTRDLSWGVNVPLEEAEDKVLYVWFDAPIGYISATKEWAEQQGDPDRWKKYWQDNDTHLTHFIGKDNIVFHCLIFPAILMAHGDYVLPENVPANEFLNLKGMKFSTSKNIAVWLDEYLEDFPPDPLRYALASTMPELRDTDFSWEDFQSRNNNELADIVGNFINRALHFAHKYFDGKVPEPAAVGDLEHRLVEALTEAGENMGEAFDNYRFRDGVRAFLLAAKAANKYFNDKEPWKTRKTDMKDCGTAIYYSIQTARALAIYMHPLMPFSADKVWKMLNLEGDVSDQQWERAAVFSVEPGHALNAPEILFEKYDDDVIQAQVEKLQNRVTESPDDEEGASYSPPGFKEQISFDDFQDLDLRVAVVSKAEAIPKADKLLKLQIDLGSEQRQIVAGIAQRFEPEELEGRRIIVVANLEPAKLMGEVSEGMLLAAEGDDQFGLLTVPEKLPPGSPIR
ncbi:MAG: methionine--tRNA ligase [Candidatus Marinimicrobia bacterium]|nr:methionine--tRNA ligase [Candidatus Neomarinimicrobiota bacterium]MCF7830125.1 methionine--tRNA ligase [Candidatus Neomarinimicrobiota bacterium]MCF7882202.1 methionine--tRNA ligase [Candidatus Neomarinimicrobiota bacterium]